MLLFLCTEASKSGLHTPSKLFDRGEGVRQLLAEMEQELRKVGASFLVHCPLFPVPWVPRTSV
jgi:hypothetical protein